MPKRMVCPDSGKRMTASIHTITVCCPACGQYVRLRKDRRMVAHAPQRLDNARLQQTADAIEKWKKERQ